MAAPKEGKEIKYKSKFWEKVGDVFFGIFVTILFTLPVWCILMIVMYFANRL